MTASQCYLWEVETIFGTESYQAESGKEWSRSRLLAMHAFIELSYWNLFNTISS